VAELNKMILTSKNISEEQKTKLKQLFPEVFTEDKIDLDKLKMTLGEEVDTGQERYGMAWPGKADCFKIIQEPSIGTLKPCREESVNFDETENLFIEGDNLEVLKLLQSTYYGKIKMIYIDPPYNTGNEFIYPDNYKENLDTYLEYTGQVDSEGKKFSTNTEADGRFHSKWMNMMYSRLFLARNLLRDDGVIFISIDDNEVANLRKLCDEIFGEENFLSQLVWKKKYIGGKHAKHFVDFHEYVLVYSKAKEQIDAFLMERPIEEMEKFEHSDEYVKERGRHYIRPLKSNLGLRETLIYPIQCPDGSSVTNQWMVAETTFFELVKDGRIIFKRNRSGEYQVYRKFYEYDGEGKVKVPSLIDDVSNANGKLEIKELFGVAEGRDIPFENPKPIGLIEYLLKPVVGANDIVLDFFAGSSTAAHALLDLNKEDGGNRKFIMVQLPETCDDTSEAYKAGFKNIADIGKERIRRVIKKIKEEQDGQLDLKQNNLDLGFKVFKLDKSNFKIWDGTIKGDTSDKDIEQQIELHIDHIDTQSSDEDILYELLLKSGFQLTTQIEEKPLAGKKVYSIEDGALLICLERELTKEVIIEMARLEPARIICLDEGFSGNDQLKTNAVEIMKSFNVNDFRTV